MEIASMLVSAEWNGDDAERGLERLDRRFEQTSRSATQTADKIERTGRQTNRTGKEFDTAGRSTQRFVGALESLATKTPSVTERLSSMGRGLSNVTGIMSGALSVFGGNLLMGGISKFADGITSLASRGMAFNDLLEKYQISLGFLMKSSDAATAHMKELVTLAARTPFKLPDVLVGSQRLQAMGFAARDVVSILTDLSDAAAGSGGTSENMESIVRAFGKIKGEGRATTEAMNMLTDAGIPAWRMLSELTGKTEANLRKLTEKGQLNGEGVIEGLRSKMRERYEGAGEAQSRTRAGRQSTFDDLLDQRLGEASLPAFSKHSALLERGAGMLGTSAAQSFAQNFAQGTDGAFSLLEKTITGLSTGNFQGLQMLGSGLGSAVVTGVGSTVQAAQEKGAEVGTAAVQAIHGGGMSAIQSTINEMRATFTNAFMQNGGGSVDARTVERLRRSITSKESNDRNIVNRDSGALGVGQVMPANVRAWTKEALGESLTPQQFLKDRVAQLKTIDFKLQQYLTEELRNSGGDMDTAIRRVAARWYSGIADLHTSQRRQSTNGRSYPSIASYSSDVLNRFNRTDTVPTVGSPSAGLRASETRGTWANSPVRGGQYVPGGNLPADVRDYMQGLDTYSVGTGGGRRMTLKEADRIARGLPANTLESDYFQRPDARGARRIGSNLTDNFFEQGRGARSMAVPVEVINWRDVFGGREAKSMLTINGTPPMLTKTSDDLLKTLPLLIPQVEKLDLAASNAFAKLNAELPPVSSAIQQITEATQGATLSQAEWVEKILQGGQATGELRKQLSDFAGDLSGIVIAGFDGGWEGARAGLRNLLSDMTQELLKSQFNKLLGKIYKLPASDEDSEQESKGGNFLTSFVNSLFKRGGDKQQQQSSGNTSSEIREANRESVGAVKDAGAANAGAVDTTGRATVGALMSTGQQTVGAMLQIASTIAAGQGRGSFWKGLFAAAAIGALNGAIGAATSGGGASSSGSGAGGSSGALTNNIGIDESIGVIKRASGGMISGPGTGTSDSILGIDALTKQASAWVSNGEFVVKESVTRKNRALLEYLNATGELPGLKSGGAFRQMFAGLQRARETARQQAFNQMFPQGRTTAMAGGGFEYRPPFNLPRRADGGMIGEDAAAMFGDFKPPTAVSSQSSEPQVVHNHHYQFSVYAQDAASIHRSERQIQRKLYGAVRKGAGNS
jgi:tape measure domain-containing protein